MTRARLMALDLSWQQSKSLCLSFPICRTGLRLLHSEVCCWEVLGVVAAAPKTQASSRAVGFDTHVRADPPGTEMVHPGPGQGAKATEAPGTLMGKRGERSSHPPKQSQKSKSPSFPWGAPTPRHLLSQTGCA